MIYVSLNKESFQYEIHELIKIFFFGREIIFIDSVEDYSGLGLLIEIRLMERETK